MRLKMIEGFNATVWRYAGVKKAEEIINNHVRSWGSIMEIGGAAGTGQPRRCSR